MKTTEKSSPLEEDQSVKVADGDYDNETIQNKNTEKVMKYHGSNDNDKQGDENDDDNNVNDDDDDDEELERLLPPKPDYNSNGDEDLDELLGIEMNTMSNSESSKPKIASLKEIRPITHNGPPPKTCCVRTYGNTIILNTTIYNNMRYGLIGPHYLGVFSTVCLLSFGTYYFTKKAFDDVGIRSGLIGCVFTTMAFYNLLRTVCTDPGIIKRDNQILRRIKNDEGEAGEKEYETVMIGQEEGWRYCGSCSVYQPPKAAHCPDCNVCVDGYDHHCPWMGTCIGKKNMSSFVCFNLTWLAFLMYSCIWVLALGPVVAKRDNKQ